MEKTDYEKKEHEARMKTIAQELEWMKIKTQNEVEIHRLRLENDHLYKKSRKTEQQISYTKHIVTLLDSVIDAQALKPSDDKQTLTDFLYERLSDMRSLSNT